VVGITQLAQYQEAYKVALSLHRQMEGLDAPALLVIFRQFENLIVPLVTEVDEGWAHCGSLGRHMTFLRRYLEQGNKAYCASDAFDIVFHDMPALADYLFQAAARPHHLDERLAEATSRLFEIEDYGSVIRATFPVLSSRIRRLFGVDPGSDGENLVNEVFARSGGTNPVVLPAEVKTAYRNLLAGFYAIFRNRLNHEDFRPSFTQARGVVEMANSLIKDLEAVAEESLQANSQEL